MLKEGQIVKSWKKRWFIVKNTKLSYYVGADVFFFPSSSSFLLLL